MTKAKDLQVGDKIKAGEMIAEIKSIREVVEGHSVVSGGKGTTKTVKYFTVEGQPEIAAWNLQKYVDQGMIEIL